MDRGYEDLSGRPSDAKRIPLACAAVAALALAFGSGFMAARRADEWHALELANATCAANLSRFVDEAAARKAAEKARSARVTSIGEHVSELACPARDEGDLKAPLWPCTASLSAEDRANAYALKAKLLESVTNAIRGRALVQARHLWEMGDVKIGHSAQLQDTSKMRAKIHAVHARHGRAAIVGVRNFAPIVCALQQALLQNLTVPTILITPGHSTLGAPFRTIGSKECALRIIQEVPLVRRWYTTHHADRDPASPKIGWLPVGFSTTWDHSPRLSGKLLGMRVVEDEAAVPALTLVEAAAYRMAVRSRLSRERLAANLEYFYVCNNDYRGRTAILNRLNDSDSLPGYTNHYPSKPRKYYCGALRSIFALSPRGTSPDGYRHLEYFLAGTIVILPEHPCMETLYRNMPAIFAEPPITKHGPITCELLMETVRKFVAPNVTFEHERLTTEYWREHVYNDAFGKLQGPGQGAGPAPSTAREGLASLASRAPGF